MTIFEYIKEEIAKMFTFLENDSGYYNENNASVLLMYNLVIKYLNKEIGDK